MLRCEQCRESLSARSDGEWAPYPSASVDAHVHSCVGCQAYAQTLGVPPLTPSSTRLLAIPTMSAARLRTILIARWVMALTGLAQIMTAIPSIFAKSGHHTDHEARHIAAFAIALGVGMMYAAWRPHRAAGMVPSFVALVVCLAISCVLHLASGELPGRAEFTHLFAPVAAGTLWLLAHVSRPQPLRRTRRRRHDQTVAHAFNPPESSLTHG